MEAQNETRMIKEETLELIRESYDTSSTIKETFMRIHQHMLNHPDHLQPKIPNFDYQIWGKEYLEIIKKIRTHQANMKNNLAELDNDMIELIMKLEEKVFSWPEILYIFGLKPINSLITVPVA